MPSRLRRLIGHASLSGWIAGGVALMGMGGVNLLPIVDYRFDVIDASCQSTSYGRPLPFLVCLDNKNFVRRHFHPDAALADLWAAASVATLAILVWESIRQRQFSLRRVLIAIGLIAILCALWLPQLFRPGY